MIPKTQPDVANCALPAKRGIALVMVLLITAIGLLFGAGALLTFRYQCQMRIDRQHELEKVYAVRSALNYIGNYAEDISLEGTPFGYHTTSDRDLNLIVKPVKRIFPDFADVRHLDIRNDGGKDRVFIFPVEGQYKDAPDYEYGRSGTTNQLYFGIKNYYDQRYGLLFPRWKAPRGAKWWVNIGMPGTGGWLHEKYGRRYFFEPRNYVPGEQTNDVMRLCIIRSVTNRRNSAGSKYGWPLSREGERAIVLEFRPLGDDVSGANAVITLDEYLYTAGASIIVTNLITWSDNIPAVNDYVGVQIAGDLITVFHSQKMSGSVDTKMLKGWRFSPNVAQLTHETYDYFEDGCTKDSDGEIVESPDLRAVIEVEASADSRPLEEENETDEQDGLNANKNDFVTDFRVTPAYQFDVFLEHPNTVTNRATVAQRILLKESKGGHTRSEYAVRTYDTHGTEHKGFRRDEREWAREQARRKGR